MALEDHLLSLVRQTKAIAESVGQTVEKVIAEISKDKAKTEAAEVPPQPPGPPMGWVTEKIVNLPAYELFHCAGEVFQLTNGSVRVRDADGLLTIVACARPFPGEGVVEFVYFHPLCKVLAPPKK